MGEGDCWEGRKVSKGLGFYPSVSLEKTLVSGGGGGVKF